MKWFTDMNVHLHKLAVDIFYSAKDNHVEMDIVWIPRNSNERADYLSKIVDLDDWRVKDDYFQLVQSCWGICSIDCFASSQNFKINRFIQNFSIRVH